MECHVPQLVDIYPADMVMYPVDGQKAVVVDNALLSVFHHIWCFVGTFTGKVLLMVEKTF